MVFKPPKRTVVDPEYAPKPVPIPGKRRKMSDEETARIGEHMARIQEMISKVEKPPSGDASPKGESTMNFEEMMSSTEGMEAMEEMMGSSFSAGELEALQAQLSAMRDTVVSEDGKQEVKAFPEMDDKLNSMNPIEMSDEDLNKLDRLLQSQGLPTDERTMDEALKEIASPMFGEDDESTELVEEEGELYSDADKKAASFPFTGELKSEEVEEDFEEPERTGEPLEKRKFEDVFGDLEGGKPLPIYRPVVTEYQNEGFQQYKRDREHEVKEKAKNIYSFPAVMVDENTSEEITLYTRGDKIAVVMHDFWEWHGQDFATLKYRIQQKAFSEQKNVFKTFSDDDYLTEFSVLWEMPIHLYNELTNETTKMNFFCEVEVDHHRQPVQQFRMSVKGAGRMIVSGVQPTMNLCMADMATQIPRPWRVKSCWSCAYSLYSPMGFTHIGGLGCFKNQEDMKNTTDMRGVYLRWRKMDQEVQEQHICEKWEHRTVPQRAPKPGEGEMRKFVFQFEE